jgi:NAD(P)-dependent dehydrogenase (short-subunit alcohol dehydrogenase family)
MPIESFEGKTAFITGGASGIGLGIARVLAGRGAQVVLADLRQDHIDRALAGFAGGDRSNAVSALQLDVTDREAYHEAAARMRDEFDGIDILVNNAGVGLEGPILEATYADYDFGFGSTSAGVINGFVEFLPQMIAHGRAGTSSRPRASAAEVGDARVAGDLRREQGGGRATTARRCKPALASTGSACRSCCPARQVEHPRDAGEPADASARGQRLQGERGEALAPDRRRQLDGARAGGETCRGRHSRQPDLHRHARLL